MKYSYYLLFASLPVSAASEAAPRRLLRATKPKITTSSSGICEVNGIDLDIVPMSRDTVASQLEEDLPQSIFNNPNIDTSAKVNRNTIQGKLLLHLPQIFFLFYNLQLTYSKLIWWRRWRLHLISILQSVILRRHLFCSLLPSSVLLSSFGYSLWLLCI